MSRYLTSWSFNDFKNALNSVGSGIIVIVKLPHEFDGFETFTRSFAMPEAPQVLILFIHLDDGERRAVDFREGFFHRSGAIVRIV